MKGETMVKRSSFGTIRKRLSDITNLHTQHKFPLKDREISSLFDESSTNDYIQQLLKENAAMMKVIQDRDKIIERTEAEMQKVKTNLQKSQLQNWHLAQSNSHMLGELNLSKDRLKALQHELACKEALFKAKVREFEDKRAKSQQCEANLNVQQERETPWTPGEEEDVVGDPLQAEKKDEENKIPKTKKKRLGRSRSLGPATSSSSQDASEKEMADNKRRCLRRQSMRLNPNEEEADVGRRTEPRVEDDDKHQESSSTKQRSLSLGGGRPLRRAAEKVQSYKEPSRLLKMRRPQ